MLPVAVPDLRFTYVFATFVNEVTGAALGTVQLTKSGTSGADQLWSTPTPISLSIPSAHVGVRMRLVGGTDPNAACGALYTECYDTDSTNGVVHIRGWSTGTAPTARNVWLLPGSCVPDAYFATADCSAGIQAEVDLGANHPTDRGRRHRRGDGERRRRRHVPADAGRHDGSGHLDRHGRTADRRQRPARRRAGLELGADDGHVDGQDLQRQEEQPVQGFRDVRPRPARVRRRRPLRPAPQRSGVRERGDLVRQQLVPDRDDATCSV